MLAAFRGVPRLLFQRLQIRLEALERFLVHPIDEEDTVEVVYFVLDAAGKKTIAAQRVCCAVLVLISDLDFLRSRDVAANFGKRQATFLGGILRFGRDLERWIADHHRHEEFEGRLPTIEFPIKIRVRFPQIDHAQLEGFAYLLRGQANAVCGVHPLDHFARELSQFPIELRDGRAFLAEHGFVEVNNSQWHGS
jgi:hypothetical protein